jgi:hypothetical protein
MLTKCAELYGLNTKFNVRVDKNKIKNKTQPKKVLYSAYQILP